MREASKRSGEHTPTSVRRFHVRVHCAANNLDGCVEVISTEKRAAEAMALRVFFRGGGWKVVDSTDITRDFERFEVA